MCKLIVNEGVSWICMTFDTLFFSHYDSPKCNNWVTNNLGYTKRANTSMLLHST